MSEGQPDHLKGGGTGPVLTLILFHYSIVVSSLLYFMTYVSSLILLCR